MGELGLLGLSYPEEYGGQGGDYYCNLVLAEEIVHSNCGGLAMGVAVHTDMATPPVLAVRHRGAEAGLPRAVDPRARRSPAWGSPSPTPARTCPGIKTRAVRDGDEWVINGSKTYITNGHRADFIVLVTKTDPDAGYDGFTLFIVDMDAPGVIREEKLRSSACTPPTPRCSRSRTCACRRRRCSARSARASTTSCGSSRASG